MSLSMVTDRTAADVISLTALEAKIKVRTATAGEWTTWVAGSKGAYNYTDMNRVGDAVAYLAEMLNGYGYSVSANPKTDWAADSVPTEAQITTYLADLNAIKDVFYGTGELPAALDSIDHTDANNIELLLLEIETYIAQMESGFRKSGTFKSGQGVILP